ncbi:zinc finger HIT domain-containing protein 3 [Protopterus annectens]|uniref:zinc finger HIT domain-containing protein 3 n=1 Tax=Protopterus annectens TaxID=7888 RepID=UPI001CFA2958|nr:zinc finger HIT domain-containing protein 3 [Protopterus annectens]
MQICNVCKSGSPKYRCPACEIKYCSVACYKKHKDECTPKTKPAVWKNSSPPHGKSFEEGDWSVDDILQESEDEESDRVPLRVLKLLGQSKKLKALLHNPHLRQVLLDVDQAEDKDHIMKAAMQEPLFVELADQCLKVVEPPDVSTVSTESDDDF